MDTLGLSAPAWLEQTLNVSRNAAWAQVHLAQRLPSMPDTAAAFERGVKRAVATRLTVQGGAWLARGRVPDT